VNLTVWHKQMYNILIATGELSRLEQQCFEQDWNVLITKYKLKS
jgi:hypothetical protein